MKTHMIALISAVLIGSAAFFVLGADDVTQAKPEVKKIDTQEFDKLRHETKAVVLDVRTKDEFVKGHVPGAVNMDVSDPQFRKKTAELDKSKTYLVHCARGMRSARASKMLAAMGFENLFDYHGGFEQWKKDGKPIEKGDAPNVAPPK